MSTKERLERIILGTLLDTSGQQYHDECMILSEDMFCRDTDRRIYGYIYKMLVQGKPTDVNSIFEEQGEKVLDILPYMVELSMDYAFDILKVKKNDEIWTANFITGEDTPYLLETFNDYVNIFIKLVYKDEKRKREYDVAAVATATR